jgi:hypothetical protein
MVSGIMPEISYVTLMNAFLTNSLVIMSATVVINLYVVACDKRGDSKRGDRIDRRCHWIFPLLYAVLILVTAFIALRWD